MTTSDDLVDLVVGAMRQANIAAGNVWSYRDWLRRRSDMDLVVVGLPSEKRTSLGRGGAQQFLVVTTLPITGRITLPANAADLDGLELQARLSILKRQIEVAIINEYELTRRLQQIPFMDSDPVVSAQGEQPVGEIQIRLGLEFYQGPEVFHLPDLTDLDEVSIQPTGYPVSGPVIDLPE